MNMKFVIISFQFQVKSASEEDALLKLRVIVCTILKKNMQVGCHVSVVLKDQLILKIVYDKNLSLICWNFFGCFAQKLSCKFVYKCTTEIWQPVWPFFVQNSGYTSFIRRFPRFATGLSQVVENSIAAALCQQLATGLLKTALLQLCHNNLRQAC
jgi:hypothetical protein